MSDQFGKWLRDSMPEVSEDRVRSEVQLAVLKERIRARAVKRRKRRTRLGLFAVPLVLVVVIAANVVDLGGDAFDLMEVEDPQAPGEVVKNEFRDAGFNYLDFESEEEIQELNQQLAAGEGVVVGLDGWRVLGKTKWTIIKEYNVFGKLVEMGSSPQSTPSEISSEYGIFIEDQWAFHESKIKSGENPPAGQMAQECDGMGFEVQYWTISTKQFGEVTYYSGKPIH